MRLFSRRVHELSGAYALNALDPAERERFERHLRRCPSCTEDVQRMTSTATALAMAVAAEPPPGLKQRVLIAAASTPQLPPLPPTAARRRHGRHVIRSAWFPRLALGVAAVGVAAAVVLAVVTVSTQDRLDTVQAQNQAIAAVLAAPDAQIATAKSSTGGNATVVLSYGQQKMIFTSAGLPPLPNAKVYELWLLSTGSAVPAGLLPQPADGKTAPVLASGLTSADKVGVTVEPAGGTGSPTTTPIIVMTLPD
ncbi:MAG TPA: anti-sigma factor [Trebonia sp.]|nr:anti-sigma factor [Trebonia sp.]